MSLKLVLQECVAPGFLHKTQLFFARSLLCAAAAAGAGCAASRMGELGEGSATLDLGTPTGQILGTLDNSEPVCIHSFRNGRYRISSPEGAGSRRCGVSPREVEPARIVYAKTAFLPWLEELEPGGMIKLDIRYAGREIFPDGKGGWRIEAPLYGQGRCFLHPSAKKRLLAAEAILRKTHPELRLLMLDCYRPQYVSQTMWDLIRDPVWVAASGKSGHNKGGSVDLTLATLAEGQVVPVDMGSAFDLFSDLSNFGAAAITGAPAANRSLLRRVMQEAGWQPYDAEWWHFFVQVDNTHLDLPL